MLHIEHLIALVAPSASLLLVDTVHEKAEVSKANGMISGEPETKPKPASKRKPMVDAGIIIIPELAQKKVRLAGPSMEGMQQYQYDLEDVIDCLTPDERAAVKKRTH